MLLALVVANDVGVKEMKDLKGKRIAFVVGSPALNQNALAMIAFGGLTQNDVKVVEFASNARHVQGHDQQRGRCGVLVHDQRP